jgi:hypothetical protein
MVTNKELHKEVKILKKIVKSILKETADYGQLTMSEAKELIKLV